jgi:response regulator RpfG family c-di-GMP phosphodiesterase
MSGVVKEVETEEKDFLTFVDLVTEEADGFDKGRWKVMIVDDDDEVQNITKFILEDFNFEGSQVELISAYSGAEALKLLKENPDTAVIFLDVVMENDTAGFYVVKYIREHMQNNNVRIILRTGQPGVSPERKAMVEYDINDYKLKTELTEDKLFISLIAALRSYRDIVKLEINKSGLESLVETSANIFRVKNQPSFFKSILDHMHSFFKMNMVGIHQGALFEGAGLVGVKQAEGFLIREGIGKYAHHVNEWVEPVLSEDAILMARESAKNHRVVFDKGSFVLCFQSETEGENMVYFETNKVLDDLDKYLIELMCGNIKIAFENICLTNEIETTQKEIIFTLGEVTEMRSRETGHHVKRVAEYMALLASLKGLGQDEVEVIRMAAPMHDVGKVGIPDFILNKPGKLTEEEFEIIKTHSKMGYDMLKSSNRKVMQTATIIALQHHEKYDGTGYPLGLSGEQIHIYGRIAAMADVFDALAVKRVYKEAWPLRDILEFFKEQRGKHFDPELVELLFLNLDAFITIKDRYPDI